jgi:REP element-mobilizing transposase RayT
MPRHARLDAPGTLHHVIGRGIPGIKIFRTKKDREDFLRRIASLCRTDAMAVYAWALMDTHFHLLVRTGKETLSSSMRKLLTGFVVNYNRRHKRYGHLFQNRYKSIVCEDDPYLLEVTRYIHLNPVRAGIIKDMAELDSYPWTGHGTIMGETQHPWQDKDTILAYFGKTEKEAKRGYRIFIAGGIRMGARPDLVGGGLKRSVGGFAEVASLRRRGEPLLSDERILGSGTFVRSILSETEGAAMIPLPGRHQYPICPHWRSASRGKRRLISHHSFRGAGEEPLHRRDVSCVRSQSRSSAIPVRQWPVFWG